MAFKEFQSVQISPSMTTPHHVNSHRHATARHVWHQFPLQCQLRPWVSVRFLLERNICATIFIVKNYYCNMKCPAETKHPFYPVIHPTETKHSFYPVIHTTETKHSFYPVIHPTETKHPFYPVTHPTEMKHPFYPVTLGFYPATRHIRSQNQTVVLLRWKWRQSNVKTATCNIKTVTI